MALSVRLISFPLWRRQAQELLVEGKSHFCKHLFLAGWAQANVCHPRRASCGRVLCLLWSQEMRVSVLVLFW